MALNYYRLLGIPPDADQQRIKTVYRSLAKRFHPDTNHGSESAAELFRQVNRAYQVLSNPETRARYDKKLARQEATTGKAKAAQATAPKVDPQQKFNRFVNSLLDALFGPLEDQPQPVDIRQQQRGTAHPPRSDKPAFNFYYHLELEKNSSPYIRGEDGIYRRTTATPNHGRGKKRRFSR